MYAFNKDRNKRARNIKFTSIFLTASVVYPYNNRKDM